MTTERELRLAKAAGWDVHTYVFLRQSGIPKCSLLEMVGTCEPYTALADEELVRVAAREGVPLDDLTDTERTGADLERCLSLRIDRSHIEALRTARASTGAA
jgi:hypothetical protein